LSLVGTTDPPIERVLFKSTSVETSSGGVIKGLAHTTWRLFVKGRAFGLPRILLPLDSIVSFQERPLGMRSLMC
jgi:hypothetical protein